MDEDNLYFKFTLNRPHPHEKSRGFCVFVLAAYTFVHQSPYFATDVYRRLDEKMTEKILEAKKSECWDEIQSLISVLDARNPS